MNVIIVSMCVFSEYLSFLVKFYYDFDIAFQKKLQNICISLFSHPLV